MLFQVYLHVLSLNISKASYLCMLIAHGEASCGVTTNSKHHHPCSRIKNAHGKDEGTNPPRKGEMKRK